MSFYCPVRFEETQFEEKQSFFRAVTLSPNHDNQVPWSMQAYKTLDMFLTAPTVDIEKSHLYINCSFFIPSVKYLAADSRVSWQKCAIVSLVFVQLYFRHKLNFQHIFQLAGRGLNRTYEKKRHSVESLSSFCSSIIFYENEEFCTFLYNKSALILARTPKPCVNSAQDTLYHLFSEEHRAELE